jgi:flagellar biosynthesis anti-sigma factor FlgM
MTIDMNFPSATAAGTSEQQRIRSTAREIDPQPGLQQDGATARVSATVGVSRTAWPSDTARVSSATPSISSLATVVHTSADVRHTKVQALHDAVAQGTYQVSPERIAESMLAQATSKVR